MMKTRAKHLMTIQKFHLHDFFKFINTEALIPLLREGESP